MITCGDKFISIIFKSMLSIVSYIGEGFCILSVLMIMLSFLGKEGKVTRKTFIPIFSMMGIVAGINVFCVIHNYLALKDVWYEPYEEGVISLVDASTFKYFIYVLVFAAIILTAFLCFTKDRVINCLKAGLMIVFFESYISTEMMCSVIYFSDEPKNYMLKFDLTSQLLGTTFDLFFTFSYLLIMLTIFFLLYFGMVKKQRTMYVGWRNRFLFIIWELLMISIMFIPILGDATNSAQIRFMGYELGIIMPVMGIVVPGLLVAIISRRYVLEKTVIQEGYISAELDYINQYKKSQNETRAFRHDIINNLSMLSLLHEEKKYDEANEYLSTLLGNVRAMSPKYITGDEMLDCIVGMKASKMDEEGIEFSIDGVIDGGLGMKPVDVCSIFANAFDNAIEACEKLSDDSEKFIKLAVKRTDKFFSIKLQNTMPKDENANLAEKIFTDGERLTTKKDKAHHGFGTQNIKASIAKYDGIEKVEVEDGLFTLSIMIPRK